MMVHTAVPSLTCILQSWGSFGAYPESEVCFRPLHPIPTLLPGSGAVGYARARQKGEPKAAAESHLCLLGLLQPLSHHRSFPSAADYCLCPDI